MKSLLTPSPKLVQVVQERAEQESRERGIPIDRICVAATPWGKLKVIVLDEPVNNN
jgi:hypothetical protein